MDFFFNGEPVVILHAPRAHTDGDSYARFWVRLQETREAAEASGFSLGTLRRAFHELGGVARKDVVFIVLLAGLAFFHARRKPGEAALAPDDHSVEVGTHGEVVGLSQHGEAEAAQGRDQGAAAHPATPAEVGDLPHLPAHLGDLDAPRR